MSGNGHGATMRLTLKVWRQDGPNSPGAFETYDVPGVSPDMSFLEMIDVVNDRLMLEGKRPIIFEHDCREGICGSCGMIINGVPHGPEKGTATCQLHMRKFHDGDQIVVEPWRAAAFPVIRDLAVDRSAFDRIIESGGYISTPTGAAPDANLTLIPKPVADAAMDAAACIGCGVCVAACPELGRPAVHQRQALLTSTCCRRARPSGGPGPRRWWRRWSSTSARAPTTASARRHARRRSRSDFIAMMNRDYVKAKRKNRQLLSQIR
ncbi:MAG: succinate dehydrogenase/fumarate reductase iron-sulfur subunit [Acidimicrobiales bacterium]